MEKHTLHVSIIGGGIGGLAAASALQRQGIQGTVFERNPELREIGVGLTLWTNGVHVLRQLGLACGHEQQTDLLVGADGLYSVIREQLLGKAPRAISATPGFRGVAFFEDAHDSPGISRETWGRGRRFGMLPIGNGRNARRTSSASLLAATIPSSS
jgi:2-polyprenyl-6-methoxyphenol hydroxylase-like FAD-dependent oxidoreductase